ncbi:MAG: class I SAM-dependent methyltransferase [bacterium]
MDNRRPCDHPVVRDYARPKLNWMFRFVTLAPEARILDVGAGNGFFSTYLNEVRDTTAIDFSGKMLTKNPVSKKVLMAAEALAFGDFTFDLVFCHALLHHVEDLDRVLSEMKRVSRKYVVIMEPNPANPLMALFSALVPEERKALGFSEKYLRGALEKQNLEVIASCAFGMLVPNKTPSFLRPLLVPFNFPQPWGMTRILVAQRK